MTQRATRHIFRQQLYLSTIPLINTLIGDDIPPIQFDVAMPLAREPAAPPIVLPDQPVVRNAHAGRSHTVGDEDRGHGIVVRIIVHRQPARRALVECDGVGRAIVVRGVGARALVREAWDCVADILRACCVSL